MGVFFSSSIPSRPFVTFGSMLHIQTHPHSPLQLCYLLCTGNYCSTKRKNSVLAKLMCLVFFLPCSCNPVNLYDETKKKLLNASSEKLNRFVFFFSKLFPPSVISPFFFTYFPHDSVVIGKFSFWIRVWVLTWQKYCGVHEVVDSVGNSSFSNGIVDFLLVFFFAS
jgi:hypothetical protein